MKKSEGKYPGLVVIIAAGGRSTRFGGGNKLLNELDGMPIFCHAVRNMYPLVAPGRMIVSVPKAEMEIFSTLLASYLDGFDILFSPGGESRMLSVANAMELAATLPRVELVAVHDAARPWAKSLLLERLLGVLADDATLDGVIPGKRVTDTIKMASADGMIEGTLERSKLWHIETPQLFRFQPLAEAYRMALAQGAQFTDDAGVMENAGGRVKIIEDKAPNIKVTYKQDLKQEFF